MTTITIGWFISAMGGLVQIILFLYLLIPRAYLQSLLSNSYMARMSTLQQCGFYPDTSDLFESMTADSENSGYVSRRNLFLVPPKNIKYSNSEVFLSNF